MRRIGRVWQDRRQRVTKRGTTCTRLIKAAIPVGGTARQAFRIVLASAWFDGAGGE